MEARALETLKAFLGIPSISTLAEYEVDVRRCAEFVRGLLEESGLHGVRLVEGKGHPLVYGEWMGAAGAPVLLCYGHYDVQPADPLEEWVSPPFEPQVRGENLYARGAADDKGLVLILIEAVRRLLERGGRLPVNVKFLIEGEEESGGEHIEEFVRSGPAELQGVDAAVIADTEMFAPELPTICVGLRGIVYGEIEVQGARQDLHSGVYGGAAPNPLQALAEIVTRLKDREGCIRIPGFYDRVQAPSEQERAAWARLPFDEQEYREREMGARELVGEPGVPLFERLWARPTFEIHGIRGGFTGEGAKTVIPARAVAKVSCRIVPDQDPAEVARQLTEAVRSATPRGVAAEFRALHAGRASRVDPSNRFVQAAARAMTETFGAETVFTRSGGSIPIVNVLAEHLGVESVMLGYGLPDDNIHAPNEKLYLPNFYRGIEATMRFFEIAAGR